MDSYWRDREEQAQAEYALTDEQYVEQLNDIYDYMLDQVKKEVNGFYSKYATTEGITMAEAQKRVAQVDIDEYERKAKKYVAEKNFSDQANREMRLYNLTMKVNRLQMLEANIGLETVSGFDELSEKLGEDLTERALQEMSRQAGILGATVQNNAKTANSIVGASFHNATFSDRIWMYQAQLRDELDGLLRNGLIQGQNPNELARHINNLFDTGKYNCERLLRTELTRVQSDAQLQSFIAAGFDEYQFNALGNACPVCRELDEQHFRIADAEPGENLPPIHPNCRCAVSAYMDDASYNEWLDSYKDHGMSYEEWKERDERNYAKAIDSMSLISGEQNTRYSREDILKELQNSPVGRDTIRAIRDSDVKIEIYDTPRRGIRGDQDQEKIRIFSSNIENITVAAQTLIHEMAHYRFGIGGCQHAEAVCYAMEKMHVENRNYLTKIEWEYVKNLAIDTYPEYNWEKGGYGDYGEFSFVTDHE